MRNFIKKQILDIFKTLYEAHDSVKSYIEKKENDNAISVLGECQNTAVQIGDIIDSSECEGTPVIHLLEEYCEVVYNVSVGLNVDISGTKARKMLDKCLLKAETGVKNDIPVRLEIVFMPYKASMWDSLESVWKAAKDDPNCNVYVIPIPYYDRNPDGALGKMHYEGGDMPRYVPLLHYEQYDLEKMRPDVIYFHNPYDNNNFVTCVDPRFHSDKLVSYTNCLVYIPYFVVDESNNIEKIDHYVITPGVNNSNYIIVQSEKVRQKYIDVLLPHYGNTNEARRFLENKIQGLGSPKFDAVRREKPLIESLPEEWRDIIGDGNKKIIFFNTHLSLLMNVNYEEFFIKLEQVFSYFKSSDDVMLLWRPHPLAVATAKSMNPAAVKPYLQIIEKYKSEKWGIYDDTPDMDRAIVLADAYYGSESSVVPVFRETGKPIMLMNIRCDNTKKQDIFRISPSAFCVVGEDIYMFHSMMNLLVKYNIVSKHTEILGQLPEEEIFQGTLVSGVFYSNGKIILIPCWANNIYIYDIVMGEFSKIKLDRNTLRSGLFIKSFLIGSKIYCFPFRSDELIIIDTNLLSVENTINIRNRIQRNYEYINEVCLIDNNKIGFVTCDSYINIFYIDNNSVQTIYSGKDNCDFTEITCCDNNIYVVDRSTCSLIKVDYLRKKLDEIYIADKYFKIYSKGTDVILDFQNKYVIFDTVNNNFSNPFYRDCGEYKTLLSYEYEYSLLSAFNDSYYEFSRYSETLYITEKDEKTEHYVELHYNDLSLFAGTNSGKENELYGLDNLVTDLKTTNNFIPENSGSNGEKIYSFIRSKLI